MKRLFIFNGATLVAYEWDKNQFKDRQEFARTEADKDKFHLYLQKYPKIPARILVDVIEEEFSQELLPYVAGPDRSALFKRTKTKKFRAQKYSYIELQERLKEGRKDLKVLVSALLAPENLEFFLDQVEESRIPIEGIYSLPIVGELLTPFILADKGNTLIISNQGPSTLRQSYYVKGRLVQSRLSSMDDEKDMEFVHLIESEISSTVRFLESARVFKRIDGLNVFIIVSDPLEDVVRNNISHLDNAQYSVLSISKVFKKIETKGKVLSEYADILYAQLLLSKTFYKNQYAPVKQRSRYYHLLIEKALNISSAILVVFTLIYLAVVVIDGLEKEDLIKQAVTDTNIVQKQLNIKQKEIVKYSYSATTTKEVVELYEKIKQKVHTKPDHLFKVLSEVLIKNPNIVTTEIIWLNTSNSAQEVPKKVDVVVVEPLDFKNKDVVLAVVKGKIISFDDNYRQAIKYYQKLIDDLRAIKGVNKVKDIESPFNLNSSATIEGDSGTSAQIKRKANATFAIKFEIGLK